MYTPQIEISNSSNAAIKVSAVELISNGGLVQNHPRRSGTYPLEIPADKTETLDVWFDLPDTINKVFKDTVELRVRYNSNHGEFTANTFLNSDDLKR